MCASIIPDYITVTQHYVIYKGGILIPHLATACLQVQLGCDFVGRGMAT